MALFKINRGNSASLPVTKTDGWAYFCTDTAEFFIDYKDNNGVLHRKQLNAKDAETLTGASLSTILNSSNMEIPTSKAVLDALASKASTSHKHNDLYYIKSEVDAAIDAIDLEIPVQATAPEDGELWVDTSENGETITPNSIGAYTKSEVNNLINTHNTNTSAHSDIRTAISNAQTAANTAQTTANSKVPLTRTVNGKSLTSDITLTASDIGLGNIQASTTDLVAGTSTLASGDIYLVYE